LAKTFQLEIITPTSIESEGQVSYVRAETKQGQFGIMARHTPAIIALEIGEIKIVKEGKDYYYATSGGYADIQPEGVLLLLETAEKKSDINIDRAKESLKRAQSILLNQDIDIKRAKSAISRARNRIKITSKF
tara:strand:+ start:27 stop:425 length:399 start_codon:yes stop_codon:yes gene_type:complete